MIPGPSPKLQLPRLLGPSSWWSSPCARWAEVTVATRSQLPEPQTSGNGGGGLLFFPRYFREVCLWVFGPFLMWSLGQLPRYPLSKTFPGSTSSLPTPKVPSSNMPCHLSNDKKTLFLRGHYYQTVPEYMCYICFCCLELFIILW